ncbi:MAG: arylesterase, partial [Acidihalobacter sp.]
PMPHLAALICFSLFDVAVHDAYGNLLGRDVYSTYSDEFMNRDLSYYIEPEEGARVSFEGKYPADFFRVPPAKTMPAWHLVGGKDLLDASELTGEEPDDGYPVLLPDWIKRDGLPWRVVNASISGDTTAGALSRLPAELARSRPSIVIIELGGNDGLRALPLSDMRDNLERLIRLAQKQGARVLLIGVRLPPNYGETYTRQFERIYPQVAKATGAKLVPHLLAGVAKDRSLMQEDGIHPLPKAQPRLLDNVWRQLAPWLKP